MKSKFVKNLLINVMNISDNDLPQYAREGDAGMDICAAEDVEIPPMEWKVVRTGIHIELPEGFECQIRSRSGLAAKHGIQVLNSPGTIDSGYRGEINVILKNNHNTKSYEVKYGDRIAQMVFAKFLTAHFHKVKVLEGSERGEGGLGSTGK